MKRIEKGETQRERQKKEKKKKEKEKKKKKKTTVLERAKGLIVGPSMCVYLQKCHHNSVFIT